MTEWQKVTDGLPEVDAPVFYYFEMVGVFRGKYLGIEDGLICFGGINGWLCGDVTHYMLDDGRDDVPERPSN